MALRLQDLISAGKVAKLSPIGGIADAMLDAQRMDQQAEQLGLQKDQFVETKRRNAEDERLRRLEESGQQARAQLKVKQEADAARQEDLKLRRSRSSEFAKLNAGGDVEGARAMLPELSSMGIDVELQDEVNGLPRYRIDIDPETTAAKTGPDTSVWGQAKAANQDEMTRAGIGYKGTELDAGIASAEGKPMSTDEAFRQAQRAQVDYSVTGQAKPADMPDFMGAVPNDVIDVPAMQESLRNRLDPALAGLANAYPEDMRESAKATGEAVRSMALNGADSLKEFATLRNGPDASIKAIRDADAQGERSRTERELRQANRGELTMQQQLEAETAGRKWGKEIGAEYNIDKIKEVRKEAQMGLAVLADKSPGNDYSAGSLFSSMMGEGSQKTEGDIQRVLGGAAKGFISNIKDRLFKEAFDGLSDEQKQGLIDIAKARLEIDRQSELKYLDNLEERASAPEMNEHVAKGIRGWYKTAIDADTRAAWEQGRAARKPAQATQVAPTAGTTAQAAPTDAGFGSELERQAGANDLNPAHIRQVIGKEGNGGVNAESGASGLIQWTKEAAAQYGLTLEQIRKMTPTEQLPYAMKWFKDKGVKKDDPVERYYMAVGAPGKMDAPDDEVIYPKGSKAVAQNSKTWDRNQDGQITAGEMREYARGGKPAGKAKTDEDKVRSILDR